MGAIVWQMTKDRTELGLGWMWAVYLLTTSHEEDLPDFTETFLVWKVHCSTPWISRWVTFRDTPTWRTPCCWAVHEQRILLTPSSQELDLVSSIMYMQIFLKRKSYYSFFQKWGQTSHLCIKICVSVWIFWKLVSQCTLRMEIRVKRFLYEFSLKMTGVTVNFNYV